MATKTPKTAQNEPEQYRMPVEVSDWIKHAESRIAYLTTTNDRLKAENAALKRANKLMEARVMGNSQE